MALADKDIAFHVYARGSTFGFSQQTVPIDPPLRGDWQITTSQENVHDGIFELKKFADNIFYLLIFADSGL